MNYLYEKVAYLRGLAEGLGIGEESKEGKLLLHVIDTLDDFADAIEDVVEEQEYLGEYVSYIDEDLDDVEEDLYGFDDDYHPLEEYYDENFEDMDFEILCCDDEEGETIED